MDIISKSQRKEIYPPEKCFSSGSRQLSIMVKTPSLKHKKTHSFRRKAFFRGSISLEGALVIPIFLFFMMTVLLGLEMVRFQSNVMEALHQTGNHMAFDPYMSNREALDHIKKYLDSQSDPYLCVEGGERGVETEIISNEKGSMFWLKTEYAMAPFISWLPIGELTFQDSFCGHRWTGYDGEDGSGAERQREPYVYVTETGSRYHLSRYCTYLRIHVEAIDFRLLEEKRNKSGGRYYACEKCRPDKQGILYITQEGSSYHNRSDCSALKRTVYIIPLSEAGAYSACIKCGK